MNGARTSARRIPCPAGTPAASVLRPAAGFLAEEAIAVKDLSAERLAQQIKNAEDEALRMENQLWSRVDDDERFACLHCRVYAVGRNETAVARREISRRTGRIQYGILKPAL